MSTTAPRAESEVRRCGVYDDRSLVIPKGRRGASLREIDAQIGQRAPFAGIKIEASRENR